MWLGLASGIAFCLFNMFWVSATFLLSGAPFHFSTIEIGLVGFAGLAGAVSSQGAGRLADMGLERQSIFGFIALMAAGLACSLASGSSLALVVIAACAVSAASQGVLILAQTMLFGLAPEARSRLNTVYVVNVFLWAAAGSALASFLWHLGGLAAVAAASLALCAVSLALWGIGCRLTPSPRNRRQAP